jgi:hypothetical protein
MPRIPNTPIGLLIRESRFAAISVGANEVMVALSDVRDFYGRLRAESSTSPVVGALLASCIEELDEITEALAERIAVLRGVSIGDVRITSDDLTGASAPGSSNIDPPGVEDSLERLSLLERQVRTSIEKTRRDPPTQLLSINVLTVVERQQWQLEQATRDDPV